MLALTEPRMATSMREDGIQSCLLPAYESASSMEFGSLEVQQRPPLKATIIQKDTC